jgi:hypothetical protein
MRIFLVSCARNCCSFSRVSPPPLMRSRFCSGAVSIRRVSYSVAQSTAESGKEEANSLTPISRLLTPSALRTEGTWP